MNRKILVAALAVGLCAGTALAEMELATPESQGVSSRAILDWIDACEKKTEQYANGAYERVGSSLARQHYWRRSFCG